MRTRKRTNHMPFSAHASRMNQEQQRRQESFQKLLVLLHFLLVLLHVPLSLVVPTLRRVQFISSLKLQQLLLSLLLLHQELLYDTSHCSHEHAPSPFFRLPVKGGCQHTPQALARGLATVFVHDLAAIGAEVTGCDNRRQRRKHNHVQLGC